jgi:plastocyanin
MRNRLALMFVALAIATGLAAIAACSKDDNKSPTSSIPELASADLLLNGTYAHVFANIGTFNYHCIHHGTMHGVVRVSDSEPVGNKTVDIQSVAFVQSDITVHSGSTVTWTNHDAVAHTVTSD